jgi:hypothetical protein
VIVDRSITIHAPAEETFRRVLDIPFVGSCLPGAKDIREESADTYRGRFSVKVGPVSVTLQGAVRVLEVDAEKRRAVLRLEGADRGIGGSVAGDMDIQVAEQADDECVLVVHTEVTIAGRLGQFGQAVMLKKADQITEGFVQEFSRRLGEQRLAAVVAEGPAGAAASQPVPAGVESFEATSAAREPAVVPPVGVATPAAPNAAVHTLGALFRRGRHIVVCGGPDDARTALRSQSDLGALWFTGTAAGSSGPEERPVPRVVAVEAADVDALLRQLRQHGAGGPGAVAAVAVVPRGAAVGDPALMAALCRRAGEVSGLPVLLVAGSPWAALTAARVGATGAAHGIAVVPHGTADHDAGEAWVPALVAESVAEIRSAGIELPVVAGPVPARSVAYLLAAGADGVLVRPPRGRLARLLRRRIRRHG